MLMHNLFDLSKIVANEKWYNDMGQRNLPSLRLGHDIRLNTDS